jgi:hypothetical protein
VTQLKTANETVMYPVNRGVFRCGLRLLCFLERGAARVLTPGVSWVCAQAADPHITGSPGFGCSK